MTSRIYIEAFDQWERVTLSSPATLNALSDTITSELLDYFTRLADRPEVRVVVLQGDGRGLTKEALDYNIDASGLEAALALEDRQQVLLTQTYNFANGVNSFRRKEAPVYNAEGDAVYGSRDYTP